MDNVTTYSISEALLLDLDAAERARPASPPPPPPPTKPEGFDDAFQELNHIKKRATSSAVTHALATKFGAHPKQIQEFIHELGYFSKPTKLGFTTVRRWARRPE